MKRFRYTIRSEQFSYSVIRKNDPGYEPQETTVVACLSLNQALLVQHEMNFLDQCAFGHHESESAKKCG